MLRWRLVEKRVPDVGTQLFEFALDTQLNHVLMVWENAILDPEDIAAATQFVGSPCPEKHPWTITQSPQRRG